MCENRSSKTQLCSVFSPKVERRNSTISGIGIFAIAEIKRGEMVFIKAGHIVPTKVAEELDRTLGDYSMQIDDDFFMAPISKEEVPGIVVGFNHSCDPNAGPRGEIVFEAIRDIGVGEEITTDYAMTVDTSKRLPYELACECGASKCRGKITGLDWKLPELQQRYREAFSPFILRKIKAAS